MIVGATASGKTEVVERLCAHIPLEAIAADSMQVYRGMDIGTAKPPPSPVRYHCIDLVDPTESFSVARYQPAALSAVAAIRGRGALPVLVGGTGLYVRAVTDEFSFPPGEPEGELREALFEQAEREGVAVLYDRLLEEDPKAAKKISSTNVRRIVRALEWLEADDLPSTRHERFQERPVRQDVWTVGLSLSRRLLKERIALRVDTMVQAGLAAEVRALWESDSLGSTAIQAIGYKELVDYFKARVSWENAVQRIVIRTRQYAKRQITWFGRDDRVTWFDATDPGVVADHIAAEVSRRGWREQLAEEREATPRG